MRSATVTRQATVLAIEALERSGWKSCRPGSAELVREFKSSAGLHCAYVRVEPQNGTGVVLSTALTSGRDEAQIGQSSVMEIQDGSTVGQVQDTVNLLTQSLLKSVGQRLASMLLKDTGELCCN